MIAAAASAAMQAVGASAAPSSLSVGKLALALKSAGMAAAGVFAGCEVFKLGQVAADLYQAENRQGVKLAPEAQARIDRGGLNGDPPQRRYEPQMHATSATVKPVVMINRPAPSERPWQALPVPELPRPTMATAHAAQPVTQNVTNHNTVTVNANGADAKAVASEVSTILKRQAAVQGRSMMFDRAAAY